MNTRVRLRKSGAVLDRLLLASSFATIAWVSFRTIGG